MLRLDPAHPPVWRSADCLQFGVDAVVVIEDPQRWQLHLIHALAQGVADDAVDAVAAIAGASEVEARGFLRRLRPALSRTESARTLVTMQTPEGYSDRATEAIADALEAAGCAVQRSTWFGAADEAPRVDHPVIVVADHLVEPRRAAPLVAYDIVHLPVVFTAGRAEIGPLVVPGSTACLACVGAHRCDADPAWPQIAAQLVGRPSVEAGLALSWEAGIAAARMLSGAEPAPRSAHSLTLHADSLRRTWRAHRSHEECRCRSLAGTETPAARAVLRHETMTAKAFARPA